MIPFIDLMREYKTIKKEIDPAINGVLKRGTFILGPEVEKFEKNFARYIGTKHCVGVASGTDALYLSLLASGIGQDDEVVVPVNTALPTATAVLMAGARPVFCDCDEDYLIDIKQVPGLITEKTKAIIPVHLYGRACDMDKLSRIARKHKLVLIEDCAQSAGAKWKGKEVGSWGDFGCFSFYPTKNLGAYGDGGAITTNSKKDCEKLKAIRFYGMPDRKKGVMFGVNSRLDELQAAILNVKLKHLDRWNEKRISNANLYRRFLKNKNIILPEKTKRKEHIYHLFVVRTKNRDKIMRKLGKSGIQTMIHHPLPLNKHPVFKYKGKFPKAEKLSKEIFSIPIHPFLKGEEILKIAKILNDQN